MALTEKEVAPWHRRIANFEHVIGRPSYITIQDGWPFGYGFMGNDHSRDADYHGAYPGNHTRRFRALFSDKQRALHLFSGRVNLEQFPGDTLDINPKLRPTWCIDVHKSQGVSIAAIYTDTTTPRDWICKDSVLSRPRKTCAVLV